MIIIHVEGRVQGVGFRALVHDQANQHGITGYVKNLQNGQVEILVDGTKEEAAELIEALQQHPGGHDIKKVTTETYAGPETYDSFDIM